MPLKKQNFRHIVLGRWWEGGERSRSPTLRQVSRTQIRLAGPTRDTFVFS